MSIFMVRVGGLLRMLNAGVNSIDPSGRTIRQQLDEIASKVGALVNEQYQCILEEVLPGLKKIRTAIHRIDELDKKERKRLEEYFELQVFPILTPLAVDAGHPFPFLANLRLNLMAVFKEANGIKVPQAYAFVEVPAILLRLNQPSLVVLPRPGGGVFPPGNPNSIMYYDPTGTTVTTNPALVAAPLDAFGRPTGEDDFVGAAGVDEPGGACPCAFVSGGGAVAKSRREAASERYGWSIQGMIRKLEVHDLLERLAG
jgi:hypothetical protein